LCHANIITTWRAPTLAVVAGRRDKATRYTSSIGPTTMILFQLTMISEEPPWWRPRDAQRFEAGEKFVDGIWQPILVDMTSTERYIVYVQTFET